MEFFFLFRLATVCLSHPIRNVSRSAFYRMIQQFSMHTQNRYKDRERHGQCVMQQQQQQQKTRRRETYCSRNVYSFLISITHCCIITEQLTWIGIMHGVLLSFFSPCLRHFKSIITHHDTPIPSFLFSSFHFVTKTMLTHLNHFEYCVVLMDVLQRKKNCAFAI